MPYFQTRARSAHRLLCRWLTGALGHEIQATDLPATPLEWQRVLRLSSAHLIGPVLPRAARAQGLWSRLPPDAAAFLEAVYTLTLDRNAQCLDQLDHLIQALNSIGVRPAILKGGAALVGGLYPSMGERIVGDIDVLIPARRLPDILERLAAAGYRSMKSGDALPGAQEFAGFSRRHHYPPIASPMWPLGVELHVAVSSAPTLLSAEEMVREATPLSWRGGDLLLPSPTHFMLHNATHAFVEDFRSSGQLSLRQLFEFVHVGRFYGERVDWDRLVRRFHDMGFRNSINGYLACAHAYLGLPIPPGVSVDGWGRGIPFIDLNGIMALFSLLRKRTKNLRMQPLDSLKKTLTPGWYSRLWHDAVHIMRKTH